LGYPKNLLRRLLEERGTDKKKREFYFSWDRLTPQRSVSESQWGGKHKGLKSSTDRQKLSSQKTPVFSSHTREKTKKIGGEDMLLIGSLLRSRAGIVIETKKAALRIPYCIGSGRKSPEWEKNIDYSD